MSAFVGSLDCITPELSNTFDGFNHYPAELSNTFDGFNHYPDRKPKTLWETQGIDCITHKTITV